MPEKIKKLFTPLNLLISGILLIAFFFRVYRIDQLLNFNYDQGRDALVIWNFIHNHKFFLIGPTTGIAGIFRGPWYYWLITPFYFIGRGNPIFPSVFLSFTVTFSLYLLYKLTREIGGVVAGLTALTIGAGSFYLILAGRWLSNPTPMFLISMGLIYSLYKILDKKDWAWVLLSFCLGMSMQFGSAAEIFYFPAVLIILIWKRLWPKRNVLVISVLVFAMTLAPQVIFDLRHNGILRGNVAGFLFSEGSFKASFWQVLKIRLPFYLDVFGAKIFPNSHGLVSVFAVILGLLVILKRKLLFTGTKFGLVSIIFVAPLIGMIFFQGNEGNVYDYYFTGYYLIFVILFSVVITSVWKNIYGKVLVILFFLIFINQNIPSVRNYIVSGVDGPTTIALGNQLQAIDWIYKDAGNHNFNVDEYVPPVIPYSYQYLLTWKSNLNLVDKQVPLLYTLYEVDPPHPERLVAWKVRQDTIGKILNEKAFGGIVAEKRLRK